MNIDTFINYIFLEGTDIPWKNKRCRLDICKLNRKRKNGSSKPRVTGKDDTVTSLVNAENNEYQRVSD